VDDLERRGRTVSIPTIRHDVSNAVGAARNALELLAENPEPEAAARFMEIAQRNVERASQLLGGASDVRSGRNERNDLGSAREGEHGETFGL
jgi:hypothetical protein